MGFLLQHGVKKVTGLFGALVLVDSIYNWLLDIVIPHLHVVAFDTLFIPVHFLTTELDHFVGSQVVLAHLAVGSSSFGLLD